MEASKPSAKLGTKVAKRDISGGDVEITTTSRDRFVEASADIMLHITDKVVDLTRKAEFQQRIQTILDPLVNHVISRVFPYILLLSIIFLILLLVTVSTFVIVMRSSIAAIKSVDMRTGLPDSW